MGIIQVYIHEVLHKFGTMGETMMADYLKRLDEMGLSRDL